MRLAKLKIHLEYDCDKLIKCKQNCGRMIAPSQMEDHLKSVKLTNLIKLFY